MTEVYDLYVCQFDSGFKITRRTKYEDFKAAILKAGRFSVFEATDTPKAAKLFTDLCKDPEVETVIDGFPWTTVKLKEKS